MPERPDLRLIAGNIREALEGYSREELLDVLTYVFKEYVVEGPPPLLVNQSERIEDLEGLGFGQLISALQTRLDLPELSLFSVDGDQVSVRVGGVLTPLTGAGVAAAPAPEPAAPPPAEPAPAERPQPGVRVEETGTVQRPERVSAPPPRGLSIRGRPAAGGAAAARPAATAATQQTQPRPTESRSEGQPANPPAAQPASSQADNKPTEPPDSDDASVRFSLLELD